MKKLVSLLFSLLLVFPLIGCVEPKQFEISLKEGLFYGVSSNNTDNEIFLEFSEIGRMEYVKTNNNKVKDLSTIDTKFYTPYHVTIIITEGNENYIIDYSEMVALNNSTTDTYKISKINGDMYNKKIDFTDFKMQLIDNDNDNIVDELKIEYNLNGEDDCAIVKFISDKQHDEVAHYGFQYECVLSYDENIYFDWKSDELFFAGKQLLYNIDKVDGYIIAMYVNNELYMEIDSDEVDTVMQFRYTTTYKNINIEFRLLEKNHIN